MTEPVNINTATFLQLKSLKGIGEAKANAILRAREEKAVKPSGEDLASTVALLRDKISSIEKDRSDMVVSFQLQADQMREKNLAILEQQRLQYEQERDEYLQKVKQELNHFREMVETKDKELDRYHEKTEKMQSQIEQQESLARIQKVITDRESKSGENYKPPSTPDKYGPSAPKLAIFDGKSDWRPYFLQFSTIADRYKWTDEQRLFKLIELLRDRALKYYSNRVKSLQANYKLFCQKFNEKFGKKELPHILRRLLQDLRQENEENLRDFAERAQELAVDGYPDTPEKFAETLATDAFLRGCLDKRAALVAMDKNPESLDQAVQFVRSAAANQKVIMGGKKSEVKRVTFSDTEDVQEQEEEKLLYGLLRKMMIKEGSEHGGQICTDVNNLEIKDIDNTAKIQELFLYKHNSDSKTLYINLTLNGQKVLAVVDSAAQVSVISTSLLKQLGPRVKMKQHIILKGAGKGSEMEARYTDDLDVTVGKLKVKWRFVAAEITDKVILGIDFLEHFKAIIDLGNYTVQINQDLIPAICLGNKEVKILHVYRVTVGRKTVVPPQSMKVLKIEIDRTPNSDIIIQPNYELKGLLTPNVVLKIGQEVSTVVRNGSNKFVTLKGGLKFGIGTEIECTIPLTDVNELDRFSDKSLNNFEPSFVTHQAAEADRVSDSLTTGSETNENSNMVPPAHTILSIKADNNHSQVSSQNRDKNMSDRVSVKQALSIKDMNELIPKHIQDLYSRTIKGMTLSENGLSRIPNHQDLCSHYSSEIPLNLLPCGGCKYCTRARSQWQIFEEDVDFVVPLTARSVSCTSPVGIIGLTIRSIRNVTSDNNVSIMGMPTSYSNDDLRQLQNQDKHLSTIIAWLTLNYTPSKQELQMQSPGVRHLWQCKSQLRYQDSILSYIWEDPVGSRILFVTPDSLKDELLRCCHDLRSSGHLGQDKTLSKLRKTAYWLKLSQIRDLPIWTQRLKKRILENVERKMLEDLTDKEEQCDLGLDWLFSNNEQMSGNMMDSSFAQSDSLTVGSNTGIGQSDFLTNKRSSQEAEQFTLQDWETLMNLDDNFGDQTIIYNVADTVEAQVKLSERNRGRDRKAPAHFKDFIMD
ncbi:unnamed protein product [Mytilus edulis]|uniref:Peptidase A2 domain-containing protein n=1 Tax=Mytilus edulis TaxID=6550 RepID=A0A8S3UJE4_MYTED|nr:unnamed protein product [Mytilus edulis]